MFKKTITYTDFNDQQQTTTVYFNLSKADIIEKEAEYEGGYAAMLKRVVESKDGALIMKTFKTLILESYGIKTPDGQGFEKSEELSKKFSQSAAYDALFTELCTDANAAIEFITRVMPLSDSQRKEVVDKAKARKSSLPAGE